MDRKNKYLLGILIALSVLVVGLIVLMVIVGVKMGGDNLDCASMEDEDSQIQCVILTYRTRDDAVQERVYNRAIDKALSEEKYARAVGLMTNMMDEFAMDEKCDKVMKIAKDDRVEKLPPEDLFTFYSYALSNVNLCGTEEDYMTMNRRANDLMDSGVLPPSEVEEYDETLDTDEEVVTEEENV